MTGLPTAIPIWAAVLSAILGMGFAVLKSGLDRRRHLSDVVALVRAELSTIVAHGEKAARQVWSTGDQHRKQLAAEADGTSVYEGGSLMHVIHQRSRFPGGGLVSLDMKNLAGLPPALTQDLMGLAIHMRDTNHWIESVAPDSGGRLNPTDLDVTFSRLNTSRARAESILREMKPCPILGGVRYPPEPMAMLG